MSCARWTECIHVLVSCAAGDGNLALNTGPMPDGQIEPRQVEIFQGIGAWLKKYGESIYGTRGGPFLAPDARLRLGKGVLRAIPIGRRPLVGRLHAQGQHHLSPHPALAERHHHAARHRANHSSATAC